MNTLSDIQKNFCHFVLSKTADLAFIGIKSNGFSPEQRLSAYRNNMLTGLTEALKTLYPVLLRLLGIDYFVQLAHDYSRSNPPLSACLLDYGKTLADFLKAYSSLQGLPYLSDVARLEWLQHESYHAAEGGFPDFAGLSRLDADSQKRLGFYVHPSVRLMASPYPIARIWQVNQLEAEVETDYIRLNEGSCQLVLFRPDWDVEMAALSMAEFIFLQALIDRQSLVQSVTKAYAQDLDFNVEKILQQCFAKRIFTDFFIFAEF